MNSSLYKELTEPELKNIISANLHTDNFTSKLLTGGLFNTTYMIETAEHKKFVLRVGPVNRHFLVPFEHHLMEAEDEVYSLCRARNIPVSDVVVTDVSKQLLDRDYMIVRYIPSKPMSEAGLSPEEQNLIFREVGTAAAKMHSIHSPHFGRVYDVKSGRGFEKWSDSLKNELDEWETVAASCGLYSEEERAAVHIIIDKASPSLDEITTPSLVHADLWSGNVLISRDADDHPEFAAIIDADRAMWGDPEYEFTTILWLSDNQNFWDGYGSSLSNDTHSIIRHCVYYLISRLIDSYVYLVEYNAPDLAEREHSNAVKQIEKLQELLGI